MHKLLQKVENVPQGVKDRQEGDALRTSCPTRFFPSDPDFRGPS